MLLWFRFRCYDLRFSLAVELLVVVIQRRFRTAGCAVAMSCDALHTSVLCLLACAAPRVFVFHVVAVLRVRKSSGWRVVGGIVVPSRVFKCSILGDAMYHFAGMLVQCTPTVSGSESVQYKQNRPSLIST